MERPLRKVRPWLDTSEKLKHRHAALLLFLELTNDQEQSMFFRENRIVLYEYCLSCFKHFSAKLTEDVTYRETIDRLLASAETSLVGYKDLQDQLRVSVAVPLAFKYAGNELINGGPEERYLSDIVGIICSLLHTNNHPVLRREGLRLLLAWLRDTRLPAGIFRDIFAESVRLQPFLGEDHSLPFGVRQTPADNIGGSSRVTPPLVQTALSPLQQSISSMRGLLQLITFESEDSSNSSKSSVAAVYQCFKESYVLPFYHQPPESFIPEQLQAIFVEYYALWTIQFLPEGFKRITIPAVCFMLSELLVGSKDELAVVNKVLQQAHLLSFNHAGSIRTAMTVVRHWVFAVKERRPEFLVGPDADAYLSMYLSMVSSIFNGRPFIGFQPEQISLYREALTFIRQLTVQSFFIGVSQEIRDQVISSLMDIGWSHFGKTNKYSLIVTPGVAEDFSGFYGETLFVAIIRLGGRQQEVWQRLGSLCRALIQWFQVVSVFGDVSTKLTEVMIEQIILSRIEPGRPSTPRGSKTSLEPVAEAGRSSPRPPEFVAWMSDSTIIGDHNRLVLLWRNFLTLFGPMNNTEMPANVHLSLTRTFSLITDRLVMVREQQPFDCEMCPPLFEGFGQLYQAARSKIDPEGRQLALLCISQLVGSSKLAVAVSSEAALKCLDAIILALEEGKKTVDVQLLSCAVTCSSILFTGQACHHQILIPHLLPIISQPSCQPFNTAMGLLGSIVGMKQEHSNDAWMSLRNLFSFYRKDMTALDIILPIISSLTINHFGAGQKEMGRQGVESLCEALCPLDDMQLPTAIASCFDGLFMWVSDCQGLGDLQLEMFIAQQLITSIRSTFVSSIARDPRAPVQDRISGLFITLLTKYLSSLPTSWLDEVSTAVVRTQVYEIVQVGLHSPLQVAQSCIVDSSQRLLDYLTLRMNIFASPIGPESLDCQFDSYRQDAVFFVMNDTLFSVQPHEQHPNKAILVIRGPAGRSVWEIDGSDCDDKGAVDHSHQPVLAHFPDRRARIEPYSEYSRAWDNDVDDGECVDKSDFLPLYNPDCDMLDKLLTYVGRVKAKDMINDKDPNDQIKHIASLCRQRFTQELLIAERYDEAVCGPSNDIGYKHEEYKYPVHPQQSKAPKYLASRRWLASLGLLSREAFLTKRIEPLKATSTLLNDIRVLDQLPSRLSIKAAVMYVPCGKETESEVFSSKDVSKNYTLFAKSLGWLVNIDKHLVIGGYTAGIESQDTEDGLLRYYADGNVEIAWHECHRLSGQGINEKRRCLGSDMVHVIWNEHLRDYRAGCVRGAVEIAITPCSSSLCIVKVSGGGLVEFGPLKGVTIQPLSAIGTLVRATVISAHIAYLSHLSRQFVERISEIKGLKKRHGLGTGFTYPQYLQAMTMLPGQQVQMMAAATPQSPNYKHVYNAEAISPIPISRTLLTNEAMENFSEYEDAVSEVVYSGIAV